MSCIECKEMKPKLAQLDDLESTFCFTTLSETKYVIVTISIGSFPVEFVSQECPNYFITDKSGKPFKYRIMFNLRGLDEVEYCTYPPTIQSIIHNRIHRST